MLDESLLQEWIGRREAAKDEVTRHAAERMAALLDLPASDLQRGATVPRTWYAMLFAPTAAQSRLAADGHPRKGTFLPPIPLPRRMFAGRRVWFRAPLRIGDEVTRASRIERIEPKTGRSGPMCFVTVRHEIACPRGIAVIEEQDIVYREESRPGATAGATRSKSEARTDASSADWSRTVVPDPTMLFRYSAITFNAHRIHYDTAYARDTEGYPDLVVNGGLTTLLLWQLAETRSGRQIAASASRNVKALYVNRPITLCGGPVTGTNSVRMLALDADGDPAVEADLELEA